MEQGLHGGCKQVWHWRAGANGAEDGVRIRGTEPVAIFTPDEVLQGWLEPRDGRLSESLNAGEPLHVELPLNGAASAWTDLPTCNLVAVTPLPRPPSSGDGTTHRRSVLDAGRYVFSGTVHVPPGAEPDLYVHRLVSAWLPMTDATVAMDSEWWAAKVVIVNMAYVERIEPAPALVGIAAT